MIRFLVIVLALCSTTSFASSLSGVNNVQFQLNRFDPSAFPRNQMGTILQKQREHSLKCVYDFSKQGGAVGAISLLDEQGKQCVLPKNGIIRDVLIDAVVTPTSGGAATIAVGSGAAANDLKAAAGFAGYSGLLAGIPVGSAASAIKLLADQNPSITVAVAALTAGKLNVHILLQVSE